MTSFKYSALSYVGRRKNNQDSCYADKLGKGLHFLAVADGMGGAAGGEIASKTVLETATSILDGIAKTKFHPDNLKEVLSQIFEDSQKALAIQIEHDPALSGMGTTLACVLLFDDKYAIGNIGDSRVYLVSQRDIKQLTTDHTYIQDHINKHGDDIPEHFYKTYGHIITRSMNGEDDKPDLFPAEKNYLTLNKGELLFLCSDGLISNKVNQDHTEFRNIIRASKDIVVTCKNLISFAFSKGSTDNITVVLGEFGKFKRNKKTTLSLEYPPNDELSFEVIKDIIDLNIENDEIDNEHKLQGEEINLSKKQYSNRKILRIAFILIFLLLIVGGGGYLYLNKGEMFSRKNNTSIRNQNKGNQPNETEQEDGLVILPFGGFEEKEDDAYLTIINKPQVTWEKYTGEGFQQYVITVDGKESFCFSEKDKTYTELSKLKITKKKTYHLTIKAVLVNDQSIDGVKKLVLVVN